MLDEVHVKVEPLEPDDEDMAATTQIIQEINLSTVTLLPQTDTRNSIALHGKELLMAALDPVCVILLKLEKNQDSLIKLTSMDETLSFYHAIGIENADRFLLNRIYQEIKTLKKRHSSIEQAIDAWIQVRIEKKLFFCRSS